MSQAVHSHQPSYALISDDGRYRYLLGRRWEDDRPSVTFVMLNPSTADATEDDPTIRRCVSFAKLWGYGGVIVVNLYALRSTNPANLWTADDPVGPENDHHLVGQAYKSAYLGIPLVVAWGANARPERVAQFLELPYVKGNTQSLGETKAGAPKHPLYLAASTRRQRWPLPRREA